jgi:hypothetical protein
VVNRNNYTIHFTADAQTFFMLQIALDYVLEGIIKTPQEEGEDKERTIMNLSRLWTIIDDALAEDKD